MLKMNTHTSHFNPTFSNDQKKKLLVSREISVSRVICELAEVVAQLYTKYIELYGHLMHAIVIQAPRSSITENEQIEMFECNGFVHGMKCNSTVCNSIQNISVNLSIICNLMTG